MRGPAAWEARQAPGDCCPAAGRRNCWAWSVLPLRPASVGAAVYCPVLGVRPLVRHTSQQNLSTDTDTLHVMAHSPACHRRLGLWEATGPRRCSHARNPTGLCSSPAAFVEPRKLLGTEARRFTPHGRRASAGRKLCTAPVAYVRTPYPVHVRGTYWPQLHSPSRKLSIALACFPARSYHYTVLVGPGAGMCAYGRRARRELRLAGNAAHAAAMLDSYYSDGVLRRGTCTSRNTTTLLCGAVGKVSKGTQVPQTRRRRTFVSQQVAIHKPATHTPKICHQPRLAIARLIRGLRPTERGRSRYYPRSTARNAPWSTEYRV